MNHIYEIETNFEEQHHWSCLVSEKIPTAEFQQLIGNATQCPRLQAKRKTLKSTSNDEIRCLEISGVFAAYSQRDKIVNCVSPNIKALTSAEEVLTKQARVINPTVLT